MLDECWKLQMGFLRLFDGMYRMNGQSAIIFDTSIHSKNLGDEIIMSSCKEILKACIGDKSFLYVPTHTLPTADELDAVRHTRLKIVCGTNILSPDFGKWSLWKMPKTLSGYRDVIALGVGWGYYSDSFTEKSRSVYQAVFSKRALHSVRDSYTEKKMKEMGIDNVVNTGCPTLWALTPEHCAAIPSVKAKNAVTALTGYPSARSVKDDSVMLDILKREYETVYIWAQGKTDREYAARLDPEGHLKLLSGGLEEYTRLLQNGNIDYVGNRLHGGIHALNCKVRSLIISIDNRAAEMGRDCSLPVIAREEVSEKLAQAINAKRETVLTIPWDNIARWKDQFRTGD